MATFLLESESTDLLPEGFGALIALLLVWTGLWLWIRKFLASCHAQLPEETWHSQPWTSWFLLLPPVNLVWNFHYTLGLSHAYRKSFEDLGRDLPMRESGRTEAVLYGVAFTVGWYPMNQTLLGLIWMGGLVALTIYLFKIHSLAQRYARIRKD
ncbi:MAG: hypothetical protein ACI9F9_000542 [Candidatus Paceibacteria bacterium]